MNENKNTNNIKLRTNKADVQRWRGLDEKLLAELCDDALAAHELLARLESVSAENDALKKELDIYRNMRNESERDPLKDDGNVGPRFPIVDSEKEWDFVGRVDDYDVWISHDRLHVDITTMKTRGAGGADQTFIETCNWEEAVDLAITKGFLVKNPKQNSINR